MIVETPLLEEEHRGYFKTTGLKNGDHAINPLVANLPEGITMCGACGEWIDVDTYEDNRVTCPNGHVHEVDIERLLDPEAGGFTLCGWSPKQFGEFCERIVFDHEGDIISHAAKRPVNFGSATAYPGYHSPLDGYSELNYGIEVKGVNWASKHRLFNGGKAKDKARKVQFARQRRHRRLIIHILVVVDFSQSHARLHIRTSEKIIFFDALRGLGKPDMVIPFDNPFVSTRLALPQPEMPF